MSSNPFSSSIATLALFVGRTTLDVPAFVTVMNIKAVHLVELLAPEPFAQGHWISRSDAVRHDNWRK